MRRNTVFPLLSLAFGGEGGNKELNCGGERNATGGALKKKIPGQKKNQGWRGASDLRANFSWPREVSPGSGRPCAALVLNWLTHCSLSLTKIKVMISWKWIFRKVSLIYKQSLGQKTVFQCCTDLRDTHVPVLPDINYWETRLYKLTTGLFLVWSTRWY